MPLLRRKARTRRPNLEPWQWRWARGEAVRPLEEGVNRFVIHTLGLPQVARSVWEAARETVLNEWAETHPGVRPPMWWRVEAPDLWAAKGLGDVPVEFRHFQGGRTSAKAQRPLLKKMGIELTPQTGGMTA